MSSEAFHILSRGGIAFDKSKSKYEVDLFKKRSLTDAKDAASLNSRSGEMPLELNFFKDIQTNLGKRKGSDTSDYPEGKRKKSGPEHLSQNEDEDGDEDGLGPNPTRAPIHRVSTRGANVPQHIDSFEALKKTYRLPSLLFSNLCTSGFNEPTSIQAYCAPILLSGRDLVAISPTGTGKTLSYLLPIFSKLLAPSLSGNAEFSPGTRAVVIVPTRELAHQIHNECLKLARGRNWKVVLLSKATLNSLSDKAVRDKVDIIISTPLRLMAALQDGGMELNNVQHLILDEADRMLDAEFLPQIQEIVANCTHPNLQKAVLSATLPAGAEKIAMTMLRDPIRVVVGLKDTPLPSITQSLTYVADDPSKLPSLLTYLAQPYNPPVLIFTSTQARASSLAQELILQGISNVDCLHAGMTQKERKDAVSRMLKGESWVMVSTEIMARGMDFKGVREVINYDFPTSVQSYIHRIGRTGRAGREGKAVTFFIDEDAPYLKMIANVILQSGFTVPEWILRLPKPSKMKRKQMGKIKRADTINPARHLGRRDAVKKRDMITGSQRRKAKEIQQRT